MNEQTLHEIATPQITRRRFLKRTTRTTLAITLASGLFSTEAWAQESSSSDIYSVELAGTPGSVRAGDEMWLMTPTPIVKTGTITPSLWEYVWLWGSYSFSVPTYSYTLTITPSYDPSYYKATTYPDDSMHFLASSGSATFDVSLEVTLGSATVRNASTSKAASWSVSLVNIYKPDLTITTTPDGPETTANGGFTIVDVPSILTPVNVVDTSTTPPTVSSSHIADLKLRLKISFGCVGAAGEGSASAESYLAVILEETVGVFHNLGKLDYPTKLGDHPDPTLTKPLGSAGPAGATFSYGSFILPSPWPLPPG
jgi:hypothetical protein